jgi:hypothetical protein
MYFGFAQTIDSLPRSRAHRSPRIRVIILAWTCPGWQVPREAAEGGYEFVGIPNPAAIRLVRTWHTAIPDHT